MNLDELLLNIKTVTFDSLVRQTDVKTDADKAFYAAKGHNIRLTADEFRQRFQVDPGCIWYTPSVSQGSLYFNPDTLAAAPFHLDYLLSGLGSFEEGFYKNIQLIESEVAEGEYMRAIMSLPDTMQLEYFNRLVEKKGSDVPGLYELFTTFYLDSDYGFGEVAPGTLQVILDAKTEKDRERTDAVLRDMPDVLKVYRGGNSASTPYEEAYSWTLDVNVANFFAARRGSDAGYLVEAEVAKKDVIDVFLDDRNEQEVLVDPSKVKVVRELPVHGLEFLKQTLPQVAPMYHKYKDRLMELEFAQDSVEHGYGHEARVMALSLIISQHLRLSLRDREVLAEAAIYHDLRRVNDIDDPQHGKDARAYYHETVGTPNPLVEFLCEFHCRPDEEGYREIRNNRRLSKDRSRAKLLLDVFKDADALDRCRFGLRDLDVNQLRLDISKQLPLVARLCLDQLKVPEKCKECKVSLEEKFQSAKAETGGLTKGNPVRDFVPGYGGR